MADAGGVDTIARRLRWILRYRDLTQRELCRRAGMAETQLGVILRRLEDNPLGVELSTLSRLAEGGKVDARARNGGYRAGRGAGSPRPRSR